MRAARIEDGIVVDLWEVPSLDCYGTMYTLVEAPEWVQIGATYVDGVFTNPPPPPETPEQTIERYVTAVQKRLDNFARTRGYDGILSAATYANSTNPKFRAEGEYAVQVRDQTWAKCYEILNAVQAGERSIPTLEELFAELPVLAWPV